MSTEPKPAPKPRTKRSWARIETKVGEDTMTFWPTPAGLHRRKKGSPKVQTETWDKVSDFMTGGPMQFEFDNRKYEVWRTPEGMNVQRSGHPVRVVKWQEFIEFIDGQKLMPI